MSIKKEELAQKLRDPSHYEIMKNWQSDKKSRQKGSSSKLGATVE